jgi:broad specificity phosphatase PhoE
MKIILVRHGESAGNVAGLINDNPSRVVNLTDRGRAQAADVAKRLSKIRFTAAYVSEFPRAQQTAKIILAYHTCTLTIDTRLNERRSGMDGLPVGAFNDLKVIDPAHFKPEHGESFLEQMERLHSFLNDAAERHRDGLVLAVSHEDPILAASAVVEGRVEPYVTGHIENCGYVELNWPKQQLPNG